MKSRGLAMDGMAYSSLALAYERAGDLPRIETLLDELDAFLKQSEVPAAAEEEDEEEEDEAFTPFVNTKGVQKFQAAAGVLLNEDGLPQQPPGVPQISQILSGVTEWNSKKIRRPARYIDEDEID